MRIDCLNGDANSLEGSTEVVAGAFNEAYLQTRSNLDVNYLGFSSGFVIYESRLGVRVSYDLIAIVIRATIDSCDRRNRLAC